MNAPRVVHACLWQGPRRSIIMEGDHPLVVEAITGLPCNITCPVSIALGRLHVVEWIGFWQRRVLLRFINKGFQLS